MSRKDILIVIAGTLGLTAALFGVAYLVIMTFLPPVETDENRRSAPPGFLDKQGLLQPRSLHEPFDYAPRYAPMPAALVA